MLYPKKFIGSINNSQILASILIDRSPLDPQENRRWGLFLKFYDDTKTGHTLARINNCDGDHFTLFPNPYQSGIEESIVSKAIDFLTLLGFSQIE